MTRRRSANGRPRQLEGAPSLMAGALAAVGLGDVAVYLQIERAFAGAVGPLIAANARPISFSRGKLVLATESATWQNELHFLRDRIVSSINAALPRSAVQQIRLVARSRRAPTATTSQAPAPALRDPSDDEQRAAAHAARAIADDDVRQAFARAMARGLHKAEINEQRGQTT
jgi:hypothetical protein